MRVFAGVVQANNGQKYAAFGVQLLQCGIVGGARSSFAATKRYRLHECVREKMLGEQPAVGDPTTSNLTDLVGFPWKICYALVEARSMKVLTWLGKRS